MKSQKESILLSYLAKECGLNKFNVLDKKDISACFEKKFYVDEIELEALMLSLERQGLIKIKYDDDNVFCLSVLGEPEEKKENPARTLFPFFLLSTLGGFIGSVLGVLFTYLILG